IDLLTGKHFARGAPPRRITDETCEVADQENRGMTEILKVLQLANEDSMAKMQIGRSWIEACFHTQRFASLQRIFEALAQVALADDLRRAFLDVRELFVKRRKRHAMCLNSSESRCSCRLSILGRYSR